MLASVRASISVLLLSAWHARGDSVEVDGMGRLHGGLSVEELAGYGTLDVNVVEEMERLTSLGLSDAVEAMIDTTAALAVHAMDGQEKPEGQTMQRFVLRFEAGMRGEPFLEVDDSPDNARYRRALFIAACRTLANAAQEYAEK